MVINLINKKKLLMYLLLFILLFQILISAIFWIYNKNYNIEFSINGFTENDLIVNGHKITYYDKEIINNENEFMNTIVFIHSPFESSFNSNLKLEKNFDINKGTNSNYKIILIDIPAHGKSFKENNYDYSFRNISSDLIKLVESLNLHNINLICDKLSSSIGLNMISLNDKIFSKVIFIDPVFKYDSNLEILHLSLKNNLLTMLDFLKLNIKKDDISYKNYITSYFNNKNSSNKYVKMMLKESIPVSIKDISSNIKIFSLITNPYYFKSNYLRELSNNTSKTFFLPINKINKNKIKIGY